MGALTPDQIEHGLGTQVVGRIGCRANGRTCVVPVTYVDDNGTISGQTAEGMKTRMRRQEPTVRFEVARVENVATWQSAIAWGSFEEVRGVDAG